MEYKIMAYRNPVIQAVLGLMFIMMAACLVYTGGCSRKEQAGIPWQSDYTQAAA